MNTPSGDYSFYQLALVSGLQKDYTGKITLLNRLVGKYPSSPYAVNAIYEKGRSYVLMDNNGQAITSFKELLENIPKAPSAGKLRLKSVCCIIRTATSTRQSMRTNK